MKTIWKFPLKIVDRQFVVMPLGSVALSVQVQGGDLGELCMWAICDPDRPKEVQVVTIFGTGNPFPDKIPGTYIGTVQMAGGALVWHVFVES